VPTCDTADVTDSAPVSGALVLTTTPGAMSNGTRNLPGRISMGWSRVPLALVLPPPVVPSLPLPGLLAAPVLSGSAQLAGEHPSSAGVGAGAVVAGVATNGIGRAPSAGQQNASSTTARFWHERGASHHPTTWAHRKRPTRPLAALTTGRSVRRGACAVAAPPSSVDPTRPGEPGADAAGGANRSVIGERRTARAVDEPPATLSRHEVVVEVVLGPVAGVAVLRGPATGISALTPPLSSGCCGIRVAAALSCGLATGDSAGRLDMDVPAAVANPLAAGNAAAASSLSLVRASALVASERVPSERADAGGAQSAPPGAAGAAASAGWCGWRKGGQHAGEMCAEARRRLAHSDEA